MATPITKLPQLSEQQLSKFVTHNEALSQIEAMLIRALDFRDTPPDSPADGDTHIVTAAAFSVVAVDTSGDTVSVSGDQSGRLAVDDALEIAESTGNDGAYVVASISYDSGADETTIGVDGSIDDATVDGDIRHAAGAFNGGEHSIAHYTGGAWVLYTAPAGLRVTLISKGLAYVRDSAGWSPLPALPSLPVRTVTGSTTLTTEDRGAVILVDTSGGEVTITLPATGEVGADYPVAVVKLTGDGNAVTITPDGGEQIDWSNEKALEEQGAGTLVVSSGTGDWIPIGGGGAGGGGGGAPAVVYSDGGDGSAAIDYTAGTVHEVTLSADPVSVSLAGAPAADQHGEVLVYLFQDIVGGRSIEWPASVAWPGGSAPALSANGEHYDVVQLSTYNGGALWVGTVRGLGIPGPQSDYSDVVLADSPTLYFRLEGDLGYGLAADSSGNGFDYTLRNYDDGSLSAPLVTGPGSGGQSYTFSPSAYIEGSFYSGDSQASGYPFSIETWFECSDTSRHQYMVGVDTGSNDGNPGNGAFIRARSSDGYLQIVFPVETIIATGSTNVLDGAAHHAVLIVTDSDATIYLDGEVEATGTHSQGFVFDYYFHAGVNGNSYGDTYASNLTLDEIAFYDHALSASRIASHNAAGRR